MDADTLQYALGLALGIVIWFLKGIMSDFKALKLEVTEHDKEIEIIKTNHLNLDRRFDKIDANVSTLTDKINILIGKLGE